MSAGREGGTLCICTLYYMYMYMYIHVCDVQECGGEGGGEVPA